MLHGPGRLEVEDYSPRGADRGEVLVRVASCGICGSDLHSFRGEHPLVIYPVTPGHEFSGTVVELGEGADEALLNRQVCVEPSLFCGKCPQCISGRYNICSSLRVMGFQAPGAMCELLAVPENRIRLLPEGLDLVTGALAEPAAVGVHAVERAGASSGDAVLVVGAGVIGLMVLQVARAVGCVVDVVEGSEARAKRSLEFGARNAEVFKPEGGPGGPSASTGPPYTAVFECVGKPETIDLAVRSAPRGSTVMVVGVPPGPVPVPMALVQDGELDLRGTLMYMGRDFERAIELLAAGLIDASDFITDRFPLEEVQSGYAVMSEAGDSTLKVLVDIS